MKNSLVRVSTAALLAVTLAAAPAAALMSHAASPTLTIAAAGSTPYSTLTLSGSGFQPGEVVQLIFGLSTATTSTDAQGTFSGATLQVPNVASGLYIVLAIGQSSGATAFSNFYVGSFYPTISPSTWWAAPGTTETFSGSGFAPNETISVTLSGSSTPFATFAADSSGTFTNQGSLTLPYALRNQSATFVVHGASSGISLSATVGIGDLYPYASPTSWYILPGNTVTFSGGGFGESEVINVYQTGSSTPVATATADQSGAFTSATPVMIPYGTGVANYSVVGASSGASVAVPITRAGFYPTLTPSAYYSAPGGTITLGGSGFAPNETVNITLGTSGSTTAHTDSTGAVAPIPVKLPAVGGQQISITGVGALSGATASFKMTMGQYYTWMVVDNWYAQGGTPLTVTGHNFAAGESIALSTVNGVFSNATADQNGDFAATTTVPYAQPGMLTLTATGSQSNAPANVNMTVAPVYTDIQLGSYAGAPGSAVEFIGHGYVPNDVVQVTTDRTGTTPVATIQADGTGSFDYKGWSIPAGWSEGNLTLTIVGTKSFDTKTITYYVAGQ